MRTSPSPDRRSRRFRWLGRVPAAVISGLAVVFAAPLLLGGAPPPAVEVLGALGLETPVILPSAEPAARVAGMEAQARRPDPAPQDRQAPDPTTLTGYVWPIHKARFTQPFGPSRWGSRLVDGEPVHDGIDLASFCGDRIVAAHAGVVLAADRRYDAFMGWIGDLTPYTERLDAKHLWSTLPIVVVIDDGNGYRSMYAHFRSVVVAPGDVVEAGDLIGYEGMTGRATGCHLHYGLYSPDEEAVFGFDPEAAARMLLPTEMIARIDPLLVLPPLEAGGIR